MAKGRLGKAQVLKNGTTAVYTNSSGAEASVSVIAQATNGSQFILKIDDSSDALVSTTTIVSEAYNERFIDYSVSNTLLSNTASPAYVAKFMSTDTTVAANYIDERFEAYVASSNTTYSLASSTSNYRACSDMTWPYETWLDIWGSKTFAFFQGGSNYYNLNKYDIATSISNADDYYKRSITADETGTITQDSGSRDISSGYSTAGVVIDYWNTDFPYVMGMQDNGYMSVVAWDTEADGFTTARNQQESSSSWAYASGVTNNVENPTQNANYKNLWASKNVVVFGGNNQYILIQVFNPDTFTSDISLANRTDRLIRSDYRRILRMNTNFTRVGGHVVFFEYNPTDGMHYMGYVAIQSSAKEFFLLKLDAAAAQEALNDSNNSAIYVGADSDTYGVTDITDDFDFTLASPYAVTDNQVTFRSAFIGTQASPLWSLTVTEFGQSTAPHVYYSTDLKTWTRSSSYYTDDYNRTVNATDVVSTSGVVTATKTNIANLGNDGVLEDLTDFSQYERTGLVLSNGDRVVTYNSGQNPISIQVMGYEGE